MKLSKKTSCYLMGLILIIIFPSFENDLPVSADTLDLPTVATTSILEEKVDSTEIVETRQTSEEEVSKIQTGIQTDLNELKSVDYSSDDSNLKDIRSNNTDGNIETVKDSYIESWEIGEGVDSNGLREWISGNLKSYIDSALQGKKLGGNVGDKIEGTINFPNQMTIDGYTASNWNNGRTIILGGSDGYYNYQNIEFSYPESIKVSLTGSDTDRTRNIIIERVAVSNVEIMSIGIDYSFSSKGTVSTNFIPKEISPGGTGNKVNYNINVNPSESVSFLDLSKSEQDEIKQQMKTSISQKVYNTVFRGLRKDLPTSLPSLGWEVGDSYTLDMVELFDDLSIDNGATIGGHITIINQPNVTYEESTNGLMKHSYTDGEMVIERQKKGFINRAVVNWNNIQIDSNDLLYRNSTGKVLVNIETPIVLDEVTVTSGARGPEKFEVETNSSITVGINEKIDEEFIKKNILKNGNIDGKEISKESIDIQYSPIDTSHSGLKNLIVSFKENYSNFISRSWDQLEVEKSINITVEDEKLTADPVSQKTSLGRDISNLDYSKFVTNVKLGNQLLSSDQYKVELINSLATDSIGIRTAQIRVTLKSDTSKAVEVDVPVEVVWGNSIVFGSYDHQSNGRTSAAFTLYTESTPTIVASQGKNNDNLAIHSYFSNQQYYTFNWFNLSNKQILKIDESNNGDKYIKASGNELKKDKLKEWGTAQNQAVNYGDIVRAWQTETTKNWLYENEQKQAYNDHKKSVYYEITKSGYRPLHFNQLTPKTGKIPIYSTNQYLDEHVTDYIDLTGYSNINVKGFAEYPDTTSSGDKRAKILVEETLTTGKKVQYEYDVTINVEPGTLTYTVPKTLTFKEFTKSKSEQIVQRKYSGSLGLLIKDNRGSNNQGNWTLTAKASSDLKGIAQHLIYRNEKGADSYLNGSAVPVYTQDKQISATEPLEVDVSSKWKSTEGILLKIPSKNNLASQEYSTTITWNLVEGP
ncbi:hypothetical protein ACP6MK_06915 [Enterococcus faecalis]|uniref:hypothetical protein n=1 Tax=Enterococcus faecalis TaxID=1351 RepID=UPI003F7F002E